VQPDQLRELAQCVGFDRDLARRLDCLADLGFEINGLILGAEQAKPGARSRLEQLKEQARRLDGGAWEYFRCIVALCRKELSSSAAVPNPGTIAELLSAINKLSNECGPAFRQSNFQYIAAKYLTSWGQITEALEHAQKATQADPFDPCAWHLLGDLHKGRAEFDEADRCYLTGLRWAADHIQLADLMVSLAACRLGRLQDLPATKPASDALSDARDRLEQVLLALKSSDLWYRTKVHYWLGEIAVAAKDDNVSTPARSASLMAPGRLRPRRPQGDPVGAGAVHAGRDGAHQVLAGQCRRRGPFAPWQLSLANRG